MFLVTHIDSQRHRRKARVTACNVNDCIEQVEAALGDHVGLSVIRMKVQPVLHLVPTAAHRAAAKAVRHA